MGIDPYLSQGLIGYDQAQAGCYGYYSTTTCSMQTVQWNTWQQSAYTNTQTTVWSTWATSLYDQQAQMCNQLLQQTLAGNQLQQAGQLDGLGGLNGLAQAGQQQWTAEDQQRYLDWHQQDEESRKKAQEERDQAEKIARKTLVEILNDRQKDSLEKEGFFYLQTAGHRYRVKPGQMVERVDDTGRVTSRFCIHAPSSYKLPPSDQAICHKLMLEAEPDYFFRTANETRVAA